MLSPDHRFVIAMHSPGGLVETGLPVRRVEKVSVRALSIVLSELSPVQSESGNARNCGDFARFQE